LLRRGENALLATTERTSWAFSKNCSATNLFKVKCNRCGEIIEGRVDLDNELSIEYEDDRQIYISRKGLIGSGENHCFQQMEVTLKFSSTKAVIDEQIQGGTFVG